jgi:hypothetical protein
MVPKTSFITSSLYKALERVVFLTLSPYLVIKELPFLLSTQTLKVLSQSVWLPKLFRSPPFIITLLKKIFYLFNSTTSRLLLDSSLFFCSTNQQYQIQIAV